MSSEHQHLSLVRISIRGQLHIHHVFTAAALVEENVTNYILVQVHDFVLPFEALMVTALHHYSKPDHLIRTQHRTAHAAASPEVRHPLVSLWLHLLCRR